MKGASLESSTTYRDRGVRSQTYEAFGDHKKDESTGQDQGPDLPYCGVHVAPHIINQTVNTCNRQHPLNNPEAQKTQTQITVFISNLKSISICRFMRSKFITKMLTR